MVQEVPQRSFGGFGGYDRTRIDGMNGLNPTIPLIRVLIHITLRGFFVYWYVPNALN